MQEGDLIGNHPRQGYGRPLTVATNKENRIHPTLIGKTYQWEWQNGAITVGMTMPSNANRVYDNWISLSLFATYIRKRKWYPLLSIIGDNFGLSKLY